MTDDAGVATFVHAEEVDPRGAGRGALGPDDPVTAAVRRWLEAEHVPARAPLIVACSGGADSLALAAAVTVVAGARPISAATVDHRLQPGSVDVARATAETLRTLGFRRVDVLPVTVRGRGGMEAAARAARYAALSALAASIASDAAVLLGHTADDQAETVLLGLARGSGPRSIAGMRPWRAPFGRPLLQVRRAQTEAACAVVGLKPWQDPHNANPAFTRVRLRREVMPLLEDVLGGGVVPALGRTAELMADDLAALDEFAERALQESSRPDRLAGSDAKPGDGDDGSPVGPDLHAAVDCAQLAGWPAAVRRRALRLWAARQAQVTTLTSAHLHRLDVLVTVGQAGSAVRLPGDIDAVRRRGRLLLIPVTVDP